MVMVLKLLKVIGSGLKIMPLCYLTGYLQQGIGLIDNNTLE